MSLNGCKLVLCDSENQNEDGEVIECTAKGNSMKIGYYSNSDYIFKHPDAKDVQCEISSKFGRIHIFNHSKRTPIFVNNFPVKFSRRLFNGNKIRILDKEFIWHSSNQLTIKIKSSLKSKSNRLSKTMDIDMNTPRRKLSLPVAAPNSEPATNQRKRFATRLSVHNFAYCVKQENQNMKKGNSLEEFKADLSKLKKEPEILDSGSSITKPHDNSITNFNISLLNNTFNKNKSNIKVNVLSGKKLKLCAQSPVQIISYTPRAAQTPNSSAYFKTKYNTPKSVYGTPIDDTALNNTAPSNYSTPILSDSNSCTSSVSMHLIDLVTPLKVPKSIKSKHHETKLLKSALKNSARKNLKSTLSAGKKENFNLIKTPMRKNLFKSKNLYKSLSDEIKFKNSNSVENTPGTSNRKSDTYSESSSEVEFLDSSSDGVIVIESSNTSKKEPVSKPVRRSLMKTNLTNSNGNSLKSIEQSNNILQNTIKMSSTSTPIPSIKNKSLRLSKTIARNAVRKSSIILNSSIPNLKVSAMNSLQEKKKKIVDFVSDTKYTKCSQYPTTPRLFNTSKNIGSTPIDFGNIFNEHSVLNETFTVDEIEDANNKCNTTENSLKSLSKDKDKTKKIIDKANVAISIGNKNISLSPEQQFDTLIGKSPIIKPITQTYSNKKNNLNGFGISSVLIPFSENSDLVKTDVQEWVEQVVNCSYDRQDENSTEINNINQGSDMGKTTCLGSFKQQNVSYVIDEDEDEEPDNGFNASVDSENRQKKIEFNNFSEIPLVSDQKSKTPITPKPKSNLSRTRAGSSAQLNVFFDIALANEYEKEQNFKNFSENPQLKDTKSLTPQPLKLEHRITRKTVGNIHDLDTSLDLVAEKNKYEKEKAFQNFSDQPQIFVTKSMTPDAPKISSKISRKTLGNLLQSNQPFDIALAKNEYEKEQNFSENPQLKDTKSLTPQPLKLERRITRKTVGNIQDLDTSLDLVAEKNKYEKDKAFQNFSDQPQIFVTKSMTPDAPKISSKISRKTLGNLLQSNQPFDIALAKNEYEKEQNFKNFSENPQLKDTKSLTPQPLKLERRITRKTVGNIQDLDTSLDLVAEKNKYEKDKAFQNFSDQPQIFVTKSMTPDAPKISSKISRKTLGNLLQSNQPFDIALAKNEYEKEQNFKNFSENPQLKDTKSLTPQPLKSERRVTRKSIGNIQDLDTSLDLEAEKNKYEKEKAFQNFSDKPQIFVTKSMTPDAPKISSKISRKTLGNLLQSNQPFDIALAKNEYEKEQNFKNFSENPQLKDTKSLTPQPLKVERRITRKTVGNIQDLDTSLDLVAEKNKYEKEKAFQNFSDQPQLFDTKSMTPDNPKLHYSKINISVKPVARQLLKIKSRATRRTIGNIDELNKSFNEEAARENYGKEFIQFLDEAKIKINEIQTSNLAIKVKSRTNKNTMNTSMQLSESSLDSEGVKRKYEEAVETTKTLDSSKTESKTIRRTEDHNAKCKIYFDSNVPKYENQEKINNRLFETEKDEFFDALDSISSFEIIDESLKATKEDYLNDNVQQSANVDLMSNTSNKLVVEDDIDMIDGTPATGSNTRKNQRMIVKTNRDKGNKDEDDINKLKEDDDQLIEKPKILDEDIVTFVKVIEDDPKQNGLQNNVVDGLGTKVARATNHMNIQATNNYIKFKENKELVYRSSNSEEELQIKKNVTEDTFKSPQTNYSVGEKYGNNSMNFEQTVDHRKNDESEIRSELNSQKRWKNKLVNETIVKELDVHTENKTGKSDILEKNSANKIHIIKDETSKKTFVIEINDKEDSSRTLKSVLKQQISPILVNSKPESSTPIDKKLPALRKRRLVSFADQIALDFSIAVHEESNIKLDHSQNNTNSELQNYTLVEENTNINEESTLLDNINNSSKPVTRSSKRLILNEAQKEKKTQKAVKVNKESKKPRGRQPRNKTKTEANSLNDKIQVNESSNSIVNDQTLPTETEVMKQLNDSQKEKVKHPKPRKVKAAQKSKENDVDISNLDETEANDKGKNNNKSSAYKTEVESNDSSNLLTRNRTLRLRKRQLSVVKETEFNIFNSFDDGMKKLNDCEETKKQVDKKSKQKKKDLEKTDKQNEMKYNVVSNTINENNAVEFEEQYSNDSMKPNNEKKTSRIRKKRAELLIKTEEQMKDSKENEIIKPKVRKAKTTNRESKKVLAEILNGENKRSEKANKQENKLKDKNLISDQINENISGKSEEVEALSNDSLNSVNEKTNKRVRGLAISPIKNADEMKMLKARKPKTGIKKTSKQEIKRGGDANDQSVTKKDEPMEIDLINETGAMTGSRVQAEKMDVKTETKKLPKSKKQSNAEPIVGRVTRSTRRNQNK